MSHGTQDGTYFTENHWWEDLRNWWTVTVTYSPCKKVDERVARSGWVAVIFQEVTEIVHEPEGMVGFQQKIVIWVVTYDYVISYIDRMIENELTSWEGEKWNCTSGAAVPQCHTAVSMTSTASTQYFTQWFVPKVAKATNREVRVHLQELFNCFRARYVLWASGHGEAVQLTCPFIYESTVILTSPDKIQSSKCVHHAYEKFCGVKVSDCLKGNITVNEHLATMSLIPLEWAQRRGWGGMSCSVRVSTIVIHHF